MKKIIFCNLDLLKLNFDPEDYQDLDLSNFNYDCLKDKRNLFLKFFKELSEGTDNLIYFYSRKSNLLTQAEQTFHEKGYNNFHFRNRNALTDFVMSNKNRNNYFVFIGGKNADFKLAVNTRSLYIVPTWLPLEDKAQKYGVHVDLVIQLYKFILTLNNQNTWYSKINVDDKTTCYSLMDARYGYYAKTSEEKEMLQHFQELLKEGKSRNYYKILLYHFLAGMTNSIEFDDYHTEDISAISRKCFSLLLQFTFFNPKTTIFCSSRYSPLKEYVFSGFSPHPMSVSYTNCLLCILKLLCNSRNPSGTRTDIVSLPSQAITASDFSFIFLSRHIVLYISSGHKKVSFSCFYLLIPSQQASHG